MRKTDSKKPFKFFETSHQSNTQNNDTDIAQKDRDHPLFETGLRQLQGPTTGALGGGPRSVKLQINTCTFSWKQRCWTAWAEGMS